MSSDPSTESTTPDSRDNHGLSLAPFRGLRPTAPDERLGDLLCPPYDVIDQQAKRELLVRHPSNAVAIILPEESDAGYAAAAKQLDDEVGAGRLAVDDEPSLYVYEMREPGGAVTRGLLGAVELRAPEDGVILPHENTMAGPVADRLAVMTATNTDLEPIYLVYDGGGAASELVRDIDAQAPAATATTPDGITHRLWIVTDPQLHDAVAEDLAGRSALIADGHHRYATYRERQRLARHDSGEGPWNRGMALVVDTSDYGPQVHAIHRVIRGLSLDDAVGRLDGVADVSPAGDLDAAAHALENADSFQVVLTDGARTFVVSGADALIERSVRPDETRALAELDVTIVHRGLVQEVWGLTDNEATVGYAHSAAEAVEAARRDGGFALLLRPTPVTAVADVAAAGARMPRKSTLFTPKPASGLVMRRLGDQPA